VLQSILIKIQLLEIIIREDEGTFEYCNITSGRVKLTCSWKTPEGPLLSWLINEFVDLEFAPAAARAINFL